MIAQRQNAHTKKWVRSRNITRTYPTIRNEHAGCTVSDAITAKEHIKWHHPSNILIDLTHDASAITSITVRERKQLHKHTTGRLLQIL
jgi:hypothetical protein